jgi:hypothetical protein
LARSALALALAIAAAGTLPCRAAAQSDAVRPSNAFEDRAEAERGLVILRLDPKGGARPEECDDVAVADLAITVGRRLARVAAVERVPRPERHWLLLDISESAEGGRLEAMRSARQYVREVMIPREDAAALVTVDDDPILVWGPSTDPSELETKIAHVPPGDWSALRDGLDAVMRQVLGDRHEHVILYWTDGEDRASTVRADDLLATLARAQNVTVFPISLLPKGARFPEPPLGGAVFTEVARRSGGEVFVSSDPRWLDRVRGWLSRRFTVSFVPPPQEDGAARAKPRLAIKVPGKRCSVTILPDPFARPDPIAGEAPPAPGEWTRLHARTPEADDVTCRAAKGEASWDWPLRAGPSGLSGCVLDIVRASGPIVRERNGRLSYTFQSPRFAARQIQVAAPSIAKLPTDAADAVESIIPEGEDDAWTISPYFMDGGALLSQRAQIAMSLFAGRADYHEFAVARLTRGAQDELRAIERDFARMFPDLPPDQIAAVARASRAGVRAASAAQTPTDTDLASVLAAWIGDMPAAKLLRRIEAKQIDARLDGGSASAGEARWASVRAQFAVPSRIRIVAPLALIHDPSQDVVGFVRIVLPRPEGFRRPGLSEATETPRPIDRIIRRPLALGLVDRVAGDPEIATILLRRGFRVVSIGYDDLRPEFKHEPNRPYEEARVTVVLASSAIDGLPTARVTLAADVSASVDGPVRVDQLTAEVTGDPEIAALLTRFRATPRRKSRPSPAPCCGRRRGSSRARDGRG